MKTIHAIWKDGQIVPVEPVDWPEGTPLSVEPREKPCRKSRKATCSATTPSPLPAGSRIFMLFPRYK